MLDVGVKQDASKCNQNCPQVNQITVIAPEDIALGHASSLALLLPLPQPATASAGPQRREATRTALRSILGRLLGRSPGSILFETSGEGKPRIAGGSDIAFNLSHSRGYSLIALSRTGDIGCDIEDRFTNEDVSGLCPLVLHPSELDAMEGLAVQERVEAFRRYWVRKEAVLKASGSGFLTDPREVITGQEDPRATWGAQSGIPFAIHNLRIGDGCLAAVASMDSVCVWRWLAAPEQPRGPHG